MSKILLINGGTVKSNLNHRLHLLLTATLSLLGLGFSQNAFAITSADVLPKGVRAGAFVFGEGQGIEDKFNSSGLLESLVSPINRSLTINDLADASPELKQLQTVLNSIGPHELGDKLLQVDLYQDLAVTEKRYVTGLLWGLTDSYSLGVIVPIVNRQYSANFRAVETSNLDDLKKIIGNPPGVEDAFKKLEEAKIDTSLFSREIFEKNGFKTPSSFNAGGLGDIEIEGRWAYYKSSLLNMQFRHNLKIPTATHEVDISNLLDRPLGQDHFSSRLAQLTDLKIVPQVLSWNTSTAVTLHAPGYQKMAVKKDIEEILPDLNDPYQVDGSVKKQTGTDFELETGLMLDLWKGVISLSGSYIYQSHFQDFYSGKRTLAYGELSDATAWQLHAMEASIEFSTVPLYLSKKVPVPARITFTWNQPLKGYNTEFAPFGRVDVILLF